MAGSGGGSTRQRTSSSSGEDASRAAIEKMYKIYEQLNSAEDKSLLEHQFCELLTAVHGTDKEKRLSSQFITRFLESFPRLEEKAINALLDLCEDDDVSIRKQVEKDLITVCKKLPHVVPKIADVFAQLMQTGDNSELTVLHNSLVSLFHINAKAAIVGLYAQIKSGDATVRDKCFKFLQVKLKDLGPEIITVDFEKRLLSETKRILPDLNGDEFKAAMDLLSDAKIMKTVTGQQAVVDMVSNILDFKKDFDATEDFAFQRLIACTEYVLPFFNSMVSSTPFAVYYCTRVLPHLGDMVLADVDQRLYLSVLRLVADVSFHVKQIDTAQAKACVTVVYNEVLQYMPLPPAEETQDPQFDFSFIECFLFVLHKFGGECPEFFTEDQDKLKEFRVRMQYLARATQAYMKKLREDLQHKKGEELKKEENRNKITSLKTLANITSVIRDLFHTPPSYKSQIGVSWRPLIRTAAAAKRKSSSGPAPARAEPTGEKPAKSGRDVPIQIYQPPSGKFSGRAGNFVPGRTRGSGPQGGFRNRYRGSGRPYRAGGGGGGRYNRF